VESTGAIERSETASGDSIGWVLLNTIELLLRNIHT
jgi:hypothetical protein